MMSDTFNPFNLYITSINFYPELIEQNIWIYPDITSRHGYTAVLLGSLELFRKENAKLYVQLESGLLPFDASINGLERTDAYIPLDVTSEDFTSDNDLNPVPSLQNISPDASLVSVNLYSQDPYYDASADNNRNNRPNLDASFVNHTARNFNLTFDLSLSPTTLSPTDPNDQGIFDTPGFFEDSYYQNFQGDLDNISTTASITVRYPFFNFNYFSFPNIHHFSNNTVLTKKLVTAPILTVIGSDLDITCDIDNNYVLDEPWTQTIDASSNHGVIENYYEEETITKLFHRLEIQKLPYGYTEYSFFDSEIKIRGYLPSKEGGYLPARYLSKNMLITDPITIGIGLLGAKLFSSELNPYIIKEFVNFQSFCQSSQLLPGWPDEMDRLWTNSTNQRNLLNNAIFGIFFLEGISKDSDDNLLEDAHYYFDIFINWIANSVDLSVGLAIDGYNPRGYTIYNYNYSASIAICCLLFKYLSVSFDFRIYDVATTLFSEAVNYINYLDEIEEEESIDFYLYYYWFGVAFNIPEIKKISIEKLKNNVNSIENIHLVEYSLRVNEVEFPEQPYTDVWDNDLLLVTLKTAFKDNVWILESIYPPNKSSSLFYNIQRDKALFSMPIGENWYPEDSLKPKGLIYELISGLLNPSKNTYNSLTALKGINNLESNGILLDDIAFKYGLKRRYFEPDKYIRKRLTYTKLYRGSREEDIQELLNFYFPEKVKKIKWNLIPPAVNFRYRLNDLWEFTTRTDYDEYDLVQQALLNQEVEGVPGLYVDKGEGFIFTPWHELIGIEITLSGYQSVYDTGLSNVIPLGIKLHYVYVERLVEEIY